MLLMTSIQPRRDGTVTLRSAAGQAIVFKPNEHGDLVAEVEDKRTIELALLTGDFEPYNEADQPTAAAILFPEVPAGGGEGGGGGGGDDDDDEDPDRDPDAPGPLPIEANTPPAEATGKPPAGNRAGNRAGGRGGRAAQANKV